MITRAHKLTILAVAALIGPCIAMAQPPAPPIAGAAGAPAAGAPAAGAPAGAPGGGAGRGAGGGGRGGAGGGRGGAAAAAPGGADPTAGGAIPARLTAAADASAPTPANKAAGIYHGKITTGPDTGKEFDLWIIHAGDDVVRLMPSRLLIDDQDMKIKEEGGMIVQAEGNVQLKIDPTSTPKKIEYHAGAVTWTGQLAQALGVDF